jgi:hypothetical protein
VTLHRHTISITLAQLQATYISQHLALPDTSIQHNCISFKQIIPQIHTSQSRFKKFHGLSPRANYTDRATAACRRSDCQLVRIEGVTWSAGRIPRPYSRFSRQEPLLFYQVAPQLYSRGWVAPVPDPLLFFPGSSGNRTRASGSVVKNSDH